MAVKNELFSRIQLKYDTYANWTATGTADQGANLVLKAGEIGICAIPSGSTAVNGDTTRPQIMFKVGDGTSKFSALPWASAKAADVYDWAKQDEATFTSWVKGLIDIGDIDLSAYYTKTQVDNLLSTNSTNDQKYADDAADGAESAAKTYADGLITALNIGNYATKTYADQAEADALAAAKTYADGLADNYATAEQGAAADTAVQSATFAGKAMTKSGTGVSISQADARTALGLGSAAYTASTAYATAAQGATADSALQKDDITSGSANGTIAVEGTDVAVKGLGSAAYTASTAYATASQGTKADNAATQTALNNEINRAKAAEAEALAAAEAAQADIDAFFADADVSTNAIDTLKEIQAQLNEGDTSAASLLAEVNKIKYGATVVPKATHAVNADNATNATTATNATQLGGTAAANYALKAYVDQAESDAVATAGTNADTKISNALKNYSTTTQMNSAISTAKSEATEYADSLASNYATAVQGAKADTAVQEITTGTSNGTISVDGTNVAVKGLGSAAYTNKNSYATAAQGELADTALQANDIVGNSSIAVTNIEFDEVTRTNVSYTSYGTVTGLYVSGTLPTGFNSRYHVADVVVNGTTYEGVTVSQGNTSEYVVGVTGIAAGNGTITSIRFYSPGKVYISAGETVAYKSEVNTAVSEAKAYADDLFETTASNYFVINCGTSTTVI